MSRLACDTSVLVPALLASHESHARALRVLLDGRVGIPAHVLAETFSVLTRLPAPHRIGSTDAAAALAQLPGEILPLDPARVIPLIMRLARHGFKGGAIYDGLVADTALQHGRTLLTLDRRALPTYDAVGAAVRWLG